MPDIKALTRITEARRLLSVCEHLDAFRERGFSDHNGGAADCVQHLADSSRLIADLCRDRIAVLTIAGEPANLYRHSVVVQGAEGAGYHAIVAQGREHQRYGDSDPDPAGSTSGNNLNLREIGS